MEPENKEALDAVTPETAPPETPAEAPPETPAETPVEAPAETLTEAPAEAVAAETPAEKPAKKKVDGSLILVVALAVVMLLAPILGGGLKLSWKLGAKPEVQYSDDAVTAQLQKLLTAYDADATVFTVGSQPVTWDVFCYQLIDGLREYAYYMGALPTDFTMVISGETTMQQYFDQKALQMTKYYAVTTDAMAAVGAAFTPEDEASLADARAAAVASNGGEQGFQDTLWDYCMTENSYNFFIRGNTAMEIILRDTYGVQGENLTTEQVAQWAADNSYIRAKHILYSFTGDDGAAMDDEGKQAQRDAAAAALAELQVLLEDPAALEARVDELIQSDSGDPGVAQFPQGYTFTTGEMIELFETAAMELEEYALSEVVETDFGCHIILRLPIDPDSATMQQDSSTGVYSTLRQMTVNSLFTDDMLRWIAEAEVVWDPAFEGFSVTDLFPDAIQ